MPLPPRRGVTLLEAVLAVVILSLAMLSTSLFVGPAFQASTRTRISAADAAGLLRLARQNAIAKQAFVDVELSGRRGRQQIVLTVSANSFDAGTQRSWPVDPTSQISGGPSKIRFAPTGDADVSLHWTVSSDQARREIQVQAAGGLIQAP